MVESSKAIDPKTGKQATTQNPVLIDMSSDVTEFQMVRRSDGVSTFDFSINNAQRKYDNLFAPNDRLFVMMKRFTWMRTFTGYFNSVPIFQAWPGLVSFNASCSLKRLQYFYWDSSLIASYSLISQALAGGQVSDADGGIRNVAKALLQTVVGWPVEKVHIGEIPADWYGFAEDIAKAVVEDTIATQAIVNQMKAATGSDPTLAGSSDSTSLAGVAHIAALGSDQQPLTYAGDIPQTSGIATNFGSAKDLSAQGGMFYGENTQTATNATDGSQFFCAIRLPFIDYSYVQAGARRPGLTQSEYAENVAWWKGRKLVVSNPDTQKAVIVTVQDSGPALIYHGKSLADRAIDLSLPALNALLKDGTTGTAYTSIPNVNIGFVTDDTLPTGPVDLSKVTNADTSTTGSADSATANSLKTTITAPTATAGTTDAHTLLQYALNLGATKIPYSQGGNRDDSLHAVAPAVVDCSSFIGNVYFHTTGLDIPGGCDVATIESYCKTQGTAISVKDAMLIQGAVLITHTPDNHIEMSIGDGTNTIGAHHTGTVTHIANGLGRFQFAYLLPKVNYTRAGPGNQAPVITSGGDTSGNLNPNVGAANGQVSSGFAPTTDVSTAPGASPIDTLFGKLGGTSWAISPADSDLSESLVGLRALLNDEPIYGYIKSLMNSSMRSFSSAPNGDFIGWFPDYYGLWGTAAILDIEPIELQNFQVSWADDSFVTHQFVTAANSSSFDAASGTLSTSDGTPEVDTVGIATIDIKGVMKALFGVENDAQYQNMVTEIYQRFGPRPDYQQAQGLFGPKGEFFYALFLFMRQWAYQFNANIEMTFMPEAWPGMLINIQAYAFQAYITTVTHTGRFGDGGTFTTVLNIASPTRTDPSRNLLIGLPLSGQIITADQGKEQLKDVSGATLKANGNLDGIPGATSGNLNPHVVVGGAV